MEVYFTWPSLITWLFIARLVPSRLSFILECLKCHGTGFRDILFSLWFFNCPTGLVHQVIATFLRSRSTIILTNPSASALEFISGLLMDCTPKSWPQLIYGDTSNNNTSGISTRWISTTTPSPQALKTELYSGHYSQQLCPLLFVLTRFSWLLEEGCWLTRLPSSTFPSPGNAKEKE